MVTSGVIFALIGFLLFKFANSAAIDYEPIKIIVNENFNALPGQVSSELQAFEPGFLHQGANFYFKPQVNLPQSVIPSHIEALISFIRHHHNSWLEDSSKFAAEKDKLMDVLKPFMYSSSDISKETPSKTDFEKENNLEIVKPPEFIPSASEEIVAEPHPVPVINIEEPKPVTELLVIPEAPRLPPLSLSIHPLVEKEVKNDGSAILQEQTGVYPTIPEITVRPIQEPIFNYVQTKAMTSELVNIPTAPVLPSLSFNGISSDVKKEKIKEKSVITEAQTGVFPTILEIAVLSQNDKSNPEEKIISYAEPKPIIAEIEIIPEAPILPPLSANDIELVEDGMKIEEPIVVEVETKPAIQEIEEVIPEAPVLSPLLLQEVPSIIKEEVKKEESFILKEPTDVFPIISEIAVRPVQEPIFNYVEPKPFITEFQVIPEAPVLPPLSAKYNKLVEEGMKIEEPIVFDIEFKPAIQVLEEIIPEAPVLPPLIHQDVPFTIKEESEILKEPTGVFPVISEIAMRPTQEPIFNYVEPKPFITEFQVVPEAPVLPPLSTNDIELVEEGLKIKEPIVIGFETKPAIPEIEEVIPEAPVLPPLPLHDVPYIVKEEVRKEELELLKEPSYVSSTIPETAVRPVQVSIFNYAEPKPFIREYPVIPEAPLLPTLSTNDIKLIEEGMEIEEPIVVNVESKPAIQEIEEVIPQAPVLPSLSLHDFPYIVKEEVRKEESELLKEPTDVFPTVPEAAVRPVQKPIFNYAEPKPFIRKFPVIPEAPLLPSLSTNNIKLIEEGMEIEEPIVVNVEPKPAIQEIEEVIPEAPVLPPLSLHNVPYIVKEEVRKEESELLKEPTDVFPTVPEAAVRPVQKPIFNYAEPKPFISKFPVIPEAPALPPLSVNDIKLIKEGMKIEEPIVVDVESKLAIQELEKVIPEAPVLSPLVLQDVPYNKNEKVKQEESEILKEPTDVFPTIPEISARPISEPVTVSESAKHFALENNYSPVGTKMNIEIPILLEESIEVFPSITERPLRPTLEPFQELEMTNSFVLEEVSEPKPEHVIRVKPLNNLRVFSYAPFVSNRATKPKKLTIPKPALLERFLLKEHQFSLPVMSFPKLSLNAMKSPIRENKKHFMYPTSYAHDVVEKRVAPNMGFKKYAPPKLVKIYVRSQVPKGSSYL